MRVIGTAGGAVGAAGASVEGRSDIAIGLLALPSLALAGNFAAAMLRDRAFRKIASKEKPDPEVLREFNIREAIRSGQLSSEDAASVLASTVG
jgi:hypothetical protein